MAARRAGRLKAPRSRPAVPPLVASGISTILFSLSQDLPPSGCYGCPNTTASSPALCSMRRLMMEFLKSPASDFVVASHQPVDNLLVTRYFHETRRPLVLQASMDRAYLCGGGGERGGEGGEGEGEGEERRQVEGEEGSGGGEERGAGVAASGDAAGTVTCAHAEVCSFACL